MLNNIFSHFLFIIYLRVRESCGKSRHPRHSPLWPRWLVGQYEMKKSLLTDVIHILHNNTAESWYGQAIAWCTLPPVLLTDSPNWSIFQVINVAWKSAWWAHEMKRSTGAALPPHSLFSFYAFKCSSLAVQRIQLEIYWSPMRSLLMHVSEADSSPKIKSD